jgi:ATP-dependent Clp protease ATP-binding subunit ClpC
MAGQHRLAARIRGAPLRRTIRSNLDRKLSRMLLSGELSPGDDVGVDVSDGTLQLTVDTPDQSSRQQPDPASDEQ